MEMQFTNVADDEALEQLFARSHEQPVVIFKHSNTCPISAMAYQRMKQFTSGVALLVVQRSRELSREVETRTGVRHESPQVLVLRRGRSVWSASHFDITAEAVEEAVRENE
ncbi:MAG: bacillithiol system redox-active protein YtxJ [Acidobacteriota bacterium]|nr:bacillithiol system redox-active protein YtxJ [Acidobacteriota bacterium]